MHYSIFLKKWPIASIFELYAIFMSTLPSIETLRKITPIDNSLIKYYPDLDFLDISDNIDKVNKKKSKNLSDIETNYHSVGYFQNERLIRIDQVGGGIPKETYIVWENGKVKEAHEFFLGICWGKKISNKEQLSSSWFYTYENDLTKKVVWLEHEDRKYYDHGKMTVTYDYEYDTKGLLFIKQTVMGEGELWKEPQIQISYDREKELFLKTCTISKSPLVASISKVSDNVIDFSISNNTRTCNCKKCEKPLSFIATVNLIDKRFNLTNIKITDTPILHCFNCMETQHYNPDSLTLPVTNKVSFTETAYKFKRGADEEALEKAFLKMGGQPMWIQEDEHPKCSKCSNTMKFILEIKTDEDLTNGIDTLAFGDSGKLYVFACCDNVTTIPQWY
ncbi:MAG: hypothetical protein QM725_08575 [Lacibacter sp.]